MYGKKFCNFTVRISLKNTNIHNGKWFWDFEFM